MPASDYPRRGRTAYLLAGIVLLGAALRFHGLAAESMWYDEGFTLCYADKVECSARTISPDVTSDAPLMAILLHGWKKVLASIPALQPGTVAYDWMLRLVACLFSIATIPLAYGAARFVVVEPSAALIAALLTAVGPFQIFYAHEIKPYSLYLALSLLALVIALDALERDRRRSWIALPFVMSLTFYSHFFAAWNVATLNLFFLLCIGRYRKHFWKWTAVQVAFVLLSAPCLMQAVKINMIYESIQNIYTIRPDFKSGFITFKTFFAGYGPRPAVYYPLLAMGGAAFMAGLWALRRRPHALVLAICLTVVPIAGNVAIWRMRHFPIYEHRLFILASVVVYMVAALAFARVPWARPRVAALAVFLAAMLPALGDYYRQRLHPNMTHRMGVRYKVQNREAAAHVGLRLRSGDIVAHASHYTFFPFLHYLSGTSVPQHNICVTDEDRKGFLGAFPNPAIWNTYGAMPLRIEEATRSAARIWWVESWWEPFEIPPHVSAMRNWMDGHFAKTDVRHFDGLTLYLYERNAPIARRAMADIEGEWGIEYNSDKPVLTIHNRGAAARTVECAVTSVSYLIEPMEFSRMDIHDDVWRPWFECLPEVAPIPTNAPAMTACLKDQAGDGAALYKDIAPVQGNYAVFARTFSNTDPVNKWRANLAFYTASVGESGLRNPLGRVAGNEPGIAVGWGWHHVGNIHADGSPFRLLITVHNDDRLERAYADFGRIALVQVVQDAGEQRTPEVERFTIMVGPLSAATRPIALPHAPQGLRRIDIDAFDATVRQYRHLFFPAEAIGGTSGG